MNSNTRIRALSCSLIACGLLCTSAAYGQAAGDQESTMVTVHGRVLNKITNEPIPRALVTAGGDEYATLTNDRGQFAISIAAPPEPANGSESRLDALSRIVESRIFQARKPGFLPPAQRSPMAFQSLVVQKDGASEITIYLQPEAMIIGHVNVPGSEGDVQIECELYRRELQGGQMAWSPAGTFRTWTGGEFRFSDLEAGTYKLITHEQMDRESLLPVPGAPLFGYPPVYYPNTTDFSAASPITVHAGETSQVNLTVARQQYYPVHIPVANPPAAGGINLNVHPMGHRSPGWSLGYNPAEEAIDGLLPDGTYTVEATSFGEPRSSGIVNFSVRGAPAEGTPLRLIPDTPLTVIVREEFASDHDAPQMMTMTPNGPRRMPDVQVSLVSMEEFDSFGGFNQARQVEGSDEHTFLLEDVGPGRYKVRVASSSGYAASIQSGGTDLLHQTLVVGLGAEIPPIEITMRDDGAEVSGTVEEAKGSELNSQANNPNRPLRFAYLLSLGDSSLQYPPMAQFQGENFQLKQVPPGNYLLLVYPDAPQDLPFGNDEAVDVLKSKGQIIQVEAGEKLSVKATMTSNGESE